MIALTFGLFGYKIEFVSSGMRFKDLNFVTFTDILDLIKSQVPEDSSLDYKATLSLQGDGNKKEFLADVSSFSNTDGGLMIFGISEAKGLPVHANGFTCTDADALILQAAAVIRDGLDPEISMRGIKMRVLTVQPNQIILILQIQPSLDGPHSIAFKQSGKFYARGPAGKYQLSNAEVRKAVSAQGLLLQTIRQRQQTSLHNLLNTPERLFIGPRIILQLYPETSLLYARTHDITGIAAGARRLRPLGNVDTSHAYNLEGLLLSARRPGNTVDAAFLQVYFDGSIETVNSIIIAPHQLDANLLERYIMSAILDYMKFYREETNDTNIRAYLTIDGLSGQSFYATQAGHLLAPQTPPARLTFDELQLKPFDFDIPDLFVWFKRLWRAWGYPNAHNFTDSGHWKFEHELRAHR
ncbi:helix-turn-helix domain-containing protein [Mucilaginibacter angelicae]|uniref:Helix-turn-helix domain-containing protein n=1 Tax=Mucilaginibacter angelicae TaxID=869718 RepID=A0ABV6L0S5_9SPHI